MPGFFSKLKGNNGGPTKLAKGRKNALQPVLQEPPKPKWEDAWTRKTVGPEEVQELLKGCTLELKSRGAENNLQIGGFHIMREAIRIITFVTLANISFSSAGHAISAPPFSTNVRPERCAYFHSKFLRPRASITWRLLDTRASAHRAYGISLHPCDL